MLTLPPSTRVFVATKPADMRRSFDGLMGLVRDFLGGLAIFYKRLEDGTYSFPAPAGDVPRLEMTAADLQLVLQGIDPTKVKRSKRYQRPTPAA
jgi:transposase